MAVETLDLLQFLATWISASVLFVLWQLGLLPASAQAILDFLSSVAVFLGLAPARDAAAAASSPRRPLSAPALPPSSPPTSSRRPYTPLDSPKTLPRFAWERTRTLASSRRLAQVHVDPALLVWYQVYVARVAESKQKKTVRFADVTQVQVISPRRSATPPEPVSAPASPPVAEPFDPDAWTERLRAFHEAISMPDCSVLRGPQLLYGNAAPAQQQDPVWRPEMPQSMPTPVRLAPPPPSPPKPTTAPPPASSSSTTTISCAPEMPQPKPAARPAAPPPPPAPKPTSAPAPASSSSATTTTCEPEKPQQAPPPPPPSALASLPPAATPVQDPSAVAKPAAPPTSTTPAAPPPAAPPQIFNLGAIASLSGLLAPQGLTPAQQKHRARVQAAVDFLARVHREAAALGQTADKSRARAWCASVRGLGRQNELGDVAAGLRTVLETAQGDDGRLRESVFPRAELGKMLLSGERIREVLKGFEAGHEIVRTEATDDIGPLVKIVKVLTEMSTFFGGH